MYAPSSCYVFLYTQEMDGAGKSGGEPEKCNFLLVLKCPLQLLSLAVALLQTSQCRHFDEDCPCPVNSGHH